MSDLISREAVIKAMENNSFMVEAFGTKRKMIDGMMFCVDIADMPTVEAVPVVHGEWKINGVNPNGVIGNFRCTICKGISLKDSNFCPNCGCDMRKKV